MGEHRRLIGIGDRIGLAPWCRDAEQLADPGEVLDAPAIGEQAIMADAVEALGQDVNKKASDELRYRQGHGPVSLATPIGIWGAVVLPLEDDASIVAAGQSAD